MVLRASCSERGSCAKSSERTRDLRMRLMANKRFLESDCLSARKISAATPEPRGAIRLKTSCLARRRQKRKWVRRRLNYRGRYLGTRPLWGYDHDFLRWQVQRLIAGLGRKATSISSEDPGPIWVRNEIQDEDAGFGRDSMPGCCTTGSGGSSS